MMTHEKMNLIYQTRYYASEVFIRKVENIDPQNIVEYILKMDLLYTCKKTKEKDLKMIGTSKQNYYFE